jgi:fumarate reductase subunit C
VSARAEARLWIAQRASAAILAVCVAVHLATIIYAVRGGLTAAEVLARTRGSILWATFYSTFVVAVAIHGAIGLRAIAAEWLGFRGRAAIATWTLVALALAAAGLRAVVAVVA